MGRMDRFSISNLLPMPESYHLPNENRTAFFKHLYIDQSFLNRT